MCIYIWDSVNKQWLEPISINFNSNCQINRITACKSGSEPLSDGWYKIEGEDLNKVAVVGYLNYNLDILNNDLELIKYKENNINIIQSFTATGNFSHWQILDSSNNILAKIYG